MNVMIGIQVPRLQCEDGRVGLGVQLDHGLHGQRPVDEVGVLVVVVLHADDDALVVLVCEEVVGWGQYGGDVVKIVMM